jgi:hypothetical protein
MRGWVCSLQLLLALASAVILRSDSRGTCDHILLSQIRDSPNLEGQVPVFISPRNGMDRLYPRHWIPFSSPPTTCRAVVEVFNSAFTRELTSDLQVEYLCNLEASIENMFIAQQWIYANHIENTSC